MLVLEEAMRLAGEKEEQTRIRKVAEQAEAGQQIMEEEPDYANENLRISKVTEMLKDYICENYMKDLSVQQIIPNLISAVYLSRVLARISHHILRNTASIWQKRCWNNLR